jgi:hypothetical protein
MVRTSRPSRARDPVPQKKAGIARFSYCSARSGYAGTPGQLFKVRKFNLFDLHMVAGLIDFKVEHIADL